MATKTFTAAELKQLVMGAASDKFPLATNWTEEVPAGTVQSFATSYLAFLAEEARKNPSIPHGKVVKAWVRNNFNAIYHTQLPYLPLVTNYSLSTDSTYVSGDETYLGSGQWITEPEGEPNVVGAPLTVIDNGLYTIYAHLNVGADGNIWLAITDQAVAYVNTDELPGNPTTSAAVTDWLQKNPIVKVELVDPTGGVLVSGEGTGVDAHGSVLFAFDSGTVETRQALFNTFKTGLNDTFTFEVALRITIQR